MTADTTPAALERIMERLNTEMVWPQSAMGVDVLAITHPLCREAAAVIAALGVERAELRARDAAPIVGERADDGAAFKTFLDENINKAEFDPLTRGYFAIFFKAGVAHGANRPVTLGQAGSIAPQGQSAQDSENISTFEKAFARWHIGQFGYDGTSPGDESRHAIQTRRALFYEFWRAAVKSPTSTPARDAGRSKTDDLVDRFAVAMKDKLRAAKEKYGHNDAWLLDDWRESLVGQLHEHIAKGDPRDVAAYCAFAWHHGWSTASTSTVPAEIASLARQLSLIDTTNDYAAESKMAAILSRYLHTIARTVGEKDNG